MPQKTKVLTVEMNVLEQTYPLVSGYLRAFARSDPALDAAYQFDTFCPERVDGFDQVMDELLRRNAAIYAFSCYVWNMAMMERLLEGLKKRRPDCTIILGGPEVIGRGADLLQSTGARVIICNGEGEQVFANVLREALNPDPDWSNVLGITYLDGAQAIRTPAQPRLEHLDMIPSPFLTGEIDGVFRTTTYETNRGCPFKCSFCYWGAAYNDRVFKFSEERVHAEIEEIGRLRIPGIYIADANWGMLKRDIAFSEHFAECSRKYSSPLTVAFTSSKNSPDRVTEITRIFADSNLTSAQPISFQTLTEGALEAVQRSNIKLAAYDTIMSDLNERGIGSFVELMWPLPGETLESFKLVFEELCLREPTALFVYAHVLLRNTPLEGERDKYGIITRDYTDNASLTKVIVQTYDVTEEDFEAGFWHIYMVKALHNARTLQTLPRYLHLSGRMAHHKLLERLAAYCKAHTDHPFARFAATSIAAFSYIETKNYPAAYINVLQTHRQEFTALLRDFAETQIWWQDDTARFLFEFDLVTKPRLFRNTPDEVTGQAFEFLTIAPGDNEDTLRITIPARFLTALGKLGVLDDPDTNDPRDFAIDVTYPPQHTSHRHDADPEDMAIYTTISIMNMATKAPQITPVGPVVETGGFLKRLLRRSA